jgi:hypothetical protein
MSILRKEQSINPLSTLPDESIQFNSGSSFSGSSNFMYNYLSQSLEQGNSVTASGLFSHAEGSSSLASGLFSHAEGFNTTASGTGSHAEGSGTKTFDLVTYSHVEGLTTQAGTNKAYSASISSGTASFMSSYGNITSSFTVGNYAIIYNPSSLAYTLPLITSRSFDSGTNITQMFFTPIGSNINPAYILNTTPSSWNGDQNTPANVAHAEGFNTVVIGAASHAEGRGTLAGGSYSHAEGQDTITVGLYSHAEGRQALSVGLYSHAEGRQTTALGDYSHAEGQTNVASGSYSHAEGLSNLAGGTHSHVEGQSNTASGNYSHAEGNATKALGPYSHTEGQGTIASGSYQTVVGRYNAQNDSTSYFIVGGGTSDSIRRDYFKVTSKPSIVVPTQSVAPSLNIEGEMVLALVSGNPRLYAYIGGTLRSCSLF